MEELKAWLDHQLDDRLVEDNGSLGKAILYMQGPLGNLDAIFIRLKAPHSTTTWWSGL